ncbi:hypothetical protein BHE74_00047614 [Ensete ventricosum]|nr:hypothetical protein BHE74_00047614 [Ensete ventricosum]
MSDLGHQDPDKEMKARWRGLKNSTKVWNDSSAAEEFERGLLHPQLARELYTLSSEVLLARAAKEMVLGQHFQMALLDRVHDAGRLITFIDYQISQLQQERDALKSAEVRRRLPRPRSMHPSCKRSSRRPGESEMKRSCGARPRKRNCMRSGVT